MEQHAIAAVEFPLGFCAVCDREVLTYIGTITYIGADEDDPRQCVHCDTPVTASLRSTALDDLSAAGYAEAPPPSACGTGGCGSGRCGK